MDSMGRLQSPVLPFCSVEVAFGEALSYVPSLQQRIPWKYSHHNIAFCPGPWQLEFLPEEKMPHFDLFIPCTASSKHLFLVHAFESKILCRLCEESGMGEKEPFILTRESFDQAKDVLFPNTSVGILENPDLNFRFLLCSCYLPHDYTEWFIKLLSDKQYN